jgi:uncharacterized protein (TIGR04255 family)
MLTSPSQKHYDNAPITEAIIDLRVEVSSKINVADLKRVQASEENTYPTIAPMHETLNQFALGPEAHATSTTQQIGFLLRSADEKQILQARMNGFTLSRLAPYQTWEKFRTEARRLWNIYRAVAEPSAVVRIAVRNINRLDIPLPVNDFSEYLRTFPEVSRDLPQGLSTYFMHLAMPLEEIKGQAMIIETIIPPVRPGIVSLVLDIDVSRTESLPADESGIWDLLEQIRNVKDNVFEGCITPKSRKLFQ